MKKYIAILLIIVSALSLFACTDQAPEDKYSSPRAPEPFCDGVREIGVTVENTMGLSTILGTDIIDTAQPLFSAAITVIPESESVMAFVKRGDSENAVINSLEISPGKSYVKVLGDDSVSKVEEHSLSSLLSRYFGEELIGRAIAAVGDNKVGYIYNKEFLDKLGKYGTLEWEENLTQPTKTATLTLTGAQIADMIDDAKEDSAHIADFFCAFVTDENSERPEELLRADEKLTFTERLTVHSTSGRVLLADITARGEDELFSLVFDGSSGDITVTAKHGTDRSAELHTEHEDGKRTITLTAKTAEREAEMCFVQTDGAVFFSCNEIGSESRQSMSLKYDKNAGTISFIYNDLTFNFSYADGALTAEAVIGKRKMALSFEKTMSDENGAVYKLTKLTTSLGDIDVSGAGVRLSVSKTTA